MVVYKLRKSRRRSCWHYEYTILNFGLVQAREYFLGLHEQFATLAENPMQGRVAQEFAPTSRRFEYQSHIVFYVLKKQGIRIVRVLHQSMDIKRYL